MRGSRIKFAILAGSSLLTAFATSAQNSPRIGYAFPAGGRPGSQVEVVVGGQFLTGVTNVCFSGKGLEATVLEHTKPLTPKERNLLQEQLKELQAKRLVSTNASDQTNWTAHDQETLREIRKKLMDFGPRRQATPAISEKVRLRVNIQEGAELGEHDLRLLTPLGLSNPIRFCVSQLPEVSHSSPTTTNPRRPPGARPVSEELRVETPCIINGQILPGEVDRFRFKAAAGQRIVFATKARGLLPYLADTVPGWFQATLALYDATGKEIEVGDDLGFDPDPVVSFAAPQNGDYVIEIRDSLYRGREDFVYRLKVGEFPYIKSFFPLGAQVGQETTLSLDGWNLPETTMEVPLYSEPGLHSIQLSREKWRLCDPVLFAVDTLPERNEKEPNDRQALSEHVNLPAVVNGRIDKPGDIDVYQIKAAEGEQVVIEVLARRLNSPLDSILTLQDASGHTLAENDDFEDRGAGLITHQADSKISYTFSKAGFYYVSLRDGQGKGGTDYAYRLRMSEPQPDFALRITPSSLTFRGINAVQATVFALRKDGFTNQIDLELVGPNYGLILKGGKVPAGMDEAKVTLVAPRYRVGTIGNLKIRGKANIQGTIVRHDALPAEQMVQAFNNRHLVPTGELKVALLPNGPNPDRNTAPQRNAP